MASAGRATVQFIGDYKQLNAGLASQLAPAKLGKMGKLGGLAIGGALAAGIGGAAVAKALFDLGKDFDRAYDKIRVGTGATGKELDKLKGSFKEVAKAVPNDFEDVGVAIADLNTRLGLTGKPLEEMAENLLHLSNITGTDLEGNIKSVAKAFVDWEVQVPKQTEYLDGLFRLSQKSGASVDQLTDSVQKFGSPLRQLGFEFGEAAATFAMFERAGVNTQTMVPGLKQAIGNLTRPTEGLATQMADLGIAVGKPDVALRQVFELLGDSKELSKVEKTGLAMDVFGKRAGSDMAEAIKQGRFEVDAFLAAFNDQSGDSIKRAADETYSFSENAKILGNNLKIYLEPAATDVFVAMDKLVRKLNEAIEANEEGRASSSDLAQALQVIGFVLRATGFIFRTFFRLLREQFRAAVANVADFRRAFEFVKRSIKGNVEFIVQAFRGMVRSAGRAFKGMVEAARDILPGMRRTFESVKDAIAGKFEAAYRAATGFIGKIIGVVNKIPGVNISFGEGKQKGGAIGLQRGGPINIGKPEGDSVPAMLERGEYVLNRKAVKRVGLEALDRLNFQNAPRFQQGGPVGYKIGGIVDTAKDAVAGAGKAIAQGIAKSASFFISKLPKPDLPQPIKGLGPWVIDQVTGFIKDKVPAITPAAGSGGQNTGTWRKANALANKYGLRITSGYRSPAQNAAANGAANSSHMRGSASNPGAHDFMPPSASSGPGPAGSYAMSNLGAIWADNHDFGSGLHLHVSWFQKGGLVDQLVGMQRGGKSPRSKKNAKKRARKLKKLSDRGLNYPGKKGLGANSLTIARLEESIAIAERDHRADFSEAGSELSASELQKEVGFYENKLELKGSRYEILKKVWNWLPGQIQNYKNMLDKAKKGSPRARALRQGLKNFGQTRNFIKRALEDLIGLTGFDGKKLKPLKEVFGGTYGDTRFKLQELGVTDTSEGRRNAEIADLLRQQLTETQKQLAVSESQMPIFQQFLPKYHQGGVVQGPRGSERPVMAQGGEGIFTADQMKAMGGQNVTVVIEDGAVDSDRIRLEVDGVLQEKVSMVRRQPSRRRY